MPPRKAPTTVVTKGGLKSVTRENWDFASSEDTFKGRHRAFVHAWQFFQYIWLSLWARGGPQSSALEIDQPTLREIVKSVLGGPRIKPSDGIQKLRDLIARYFPAYQAATGYDKVDIGSAHGWAHYQAIEMLKCIHNHVRSQFGRRVKEIIYKILGTGRLAAEVRSAVAEPGGSRFWVKQNVDQQVYVPAHEVAVAVGYLHPVEVCNLSEGRQQLLQDFIELIRSSMPADHKVKKDYIFYDVKANPGVYLSLFVKVLRFCERNNTLRDPQVAKRVSRLQQLRKRSKQAEPRAPSTRYEGNSQPFLKQAAGSKRKRPSSPRTYLRSSKKRRTSQADTANAEEPSPAERRPVLPTFNPLPLTTSWTPSAGMVDTTLVAKSLFEEEPNVDPKLEGTAKNLAIWGHGLDLDAKLFKAKHNKTLSFVGSIVTNGVSVSVLKQKPEQTRGARMRQKKKALGAAGNAGRGGTGDGGKATSDDGAGDASAGGDGSVSEGGERHANLAREILPVSEDGAGAAIVAGGTDSARPQDTGGDATVPDEAAGPSGSAANQPPHGSGEQTAREGSSGRGGRVKFTYVHKLPRATVKKLFEDGAAVIYFDPNCRDIIYGIHDASTNETRLVFRFTLNELHVLSGRRAYRRVCELRKPRKVRAAERQLSHGPRPACTDPRAILAYARVRARAEKVLRRYYGQPFFRQKQLQLYGREQRTYANLINRLKSSFSGLKVVVFGDWRPQNLRHHPPIPLEKLKRLFQQAGFQVYLIDEYCTSKFCPVCKKELKKGFKTVRNPRTHREHDQPTKPCHGLLYCDSKQCKKEVARRQDEEAAKKEAGLKGVGKARRNKGPVDNGKVSYWKKKRMAWKEKAAAKKRTAAKVKTATKELPPDASPEEKKKVMRKLKKATKKAKGKQRKTTREAARRQAQRDKNRELNEKFWEDHPELKGCRFWNRDTVAVLNQRIILRSLRDKGIVPPRFRRPKPLLKAPSWLVGGAGGPAPSARSRGGKR